MFAAVDDKQQLLVIDMGTTCQQIIEYILVSINDYYSLSTIDEDDSLDGGSDATTGFSQYQLTAVYCWLNLKVHNFTNKIEYHYV